MTNIDQPTPAAEVGEDIRRAIENANQRIAAANTEVDSLMGLKNRTEIELSTLTDRKTDLDKIVSTKNLEKLDLELAIAHLEELKETRIKEVAVFDEDMRRRKEMMEHNETALRIQAESSTQLQKSIEQRNEALVAREQAVIEREEEMERKKSLLEETIKQL